MGLFGNKGGWFGKKFDQFTGDVGQLFSDPKAWSQQHRNAILGTIIAPGIGTLIGSGVDDRGGGPAGDAVRRCADRSGRRTVGRRR